MVAVYPYDLKSAQFTHLWPLSKWKWEMGKVKSDDWKIEGTLANMFMKASTKPEMFSPECISRIEDVVMQIQENKGLNLNFRMGFLEMELAGESEGKASGNRVLHFCTLVDYKGATFVLPRVHSADRYTMLDDKLTEWQKSYLVSCGIEALFCVEPPIAGVVMAMLSKHAGPGSGTGKVFMGNQRRVCEAFQNPENPNMIYFYFASGDSNLSNAAASDELFQEIAFLIDDVINENFLSTPLDPVEGQSRGNLSSASNRAALSNLFPSPLNYNAR